MPEPFALGLGRGQGVVIQGGGTTFVTGGTGSPGFAPVITKLGFRFENGSGRLDCLALTASAAAGTPGGGVFDNNVMYVTGPVTAAEVRGSAAVLTGTATVTGLGAGSKVPFTETAKRGGPGTRCVLVLSGLTFDEPLLEGSVTFPGGD